MSRADKKQKGVLLMLTKEQKTRVREMYAEKWHNDPRMVDYCANRIGSVIDLPSGDFVIVEKQKIETMFCFGESGYDFDEAVEKAHEARTSEEHFMEENMKRHMEMHEEIERQFYMFTASPFLPHRILVLDRMGWHEMSFLRATEVIEALGGSARIEELAGREFTLNRVQYRIPTIEELVAIRNGYMDAMDAHRKKVQRYLKRYGLSKVTAWTYWRDA